jgi:aminoglycoside/choline kinase family phosphotransferase
LSGDSERFVRVALLLGSAGVHAPVVVAQNVVGGFVLMGDLGDTTYLSALNDNNADSLLEPAIDMLIRWQRASRSGSLPSVNERLLRREMSLFARWYVSCHLGLILNRSRQRALERVFDTIVANNLSQPIVYVHRDYTPRNLMVCDPSPGVLDFQDAANGPITYDVASLFWSSTRDWPEERVRGWAIRYWKNARRVGVPVQDTVDEFWESLTGTMIQRHLKMLGVFARLKYRAGKPQYLENSPRVLRRLRTFAATSSALAPLIEILDTLGNPAPPPRVEGEGRRS